MAARVGPYEVDSLIGEGGMGRVLKARDVRLRRDVTLKVLDVGEAGGHQAERFGREARAASALNHPHIATIYDIGQTEALAYIAMELVDGESLKQRLDRGPLALDEALLVAVQVADGLAAAHAKGIVHRDLKPGNIMLDADGRAKIVDFGLAKFEGTPADGGESTGGTIHQAPPETIADPLTAKGLVFGTVTYMSPEQARGATVDYRSDLFFFGSLLYEIMSGERPFARPSDAETVAAILKDDPVPLDSTVPEPLRWAIDRCLQKEPGDRYESTRDLARTLEAVAAQRSRAVERQAPCPGCGWENEWSQKFCGHCGHQLERQCPACQAAVARDASFCGSCGARLGVMAGGTERVTAPTPAPGARTTSSVMASERRQATILVSRLSLYESLIEQALPDEIERRVARLGDTAREVVERCGGVIDRVGDDEIVALFGIPLAQEDDAVRAGRAALELHARLKDEPVAGTSGTLGKGFELSSTIHTGQVVTQVAVAGRAAPRIIGEAVSVALGLARVAEGGQILLSPASHRVAGTRLRTEPLEPVRIRSAGDPLVPHRLLGVDDVSGSKDRRT